MISTRTRALTFALLLGLLCPTLALAQDDEKRGGLDPERLQEIIELALEQARRAKVGKERPADAKTRAEWATVKKLRRRLDGSTVTINFKGTPFSECIDFIRDVTGFNIVVSKEAQKEFDEEGVDLRLKKVKLRNCIELLLEQVSKDLSYGFRNGVLWIGKAETFKTKTILRTYYVGDITRAPKDFPAPRLGLKGLKFGY